MAHYIALSVLKHCIQCGTDVIKIKPPPSCGHPPSSSSTLLHQTGPSSSEWHLILLSQVSLQLVGAIPHHHHCPLKA